MSAQQGQPGRWRMRHLREILVVAILIGVATSAWFLRDDIDFPALRELALSPGGLLILAAIAVGAVAAGCPGTLISIGSGIALGFWSGFPVAFGAAYIAAWLTWTLGRFGYRGPVGEEQDPGGALGFVRRLTRAVGRADWRVVAILRLIPVLPFALTNYTLGRCGVPPLSYAVGTALGMIPGTAVHVALGAAGARTLSGEGGVHPLEWALLGLGVAALFGLSWYFLKRLPVRGTASADPEQDLNSSEQRFDRPEHAS